jgi:hypothetical protein
MNCKTSKLPTLVLATLIAAVGLAVPASAQFYVGRIDVTLMDQTGGRLPGVTVDITGPANQSAVSDAQGEAHFLNLPVGTYVVKANLAGFKPYENPNVPVVSGGAVPLEVRLGVAGTAETVIVTAETPVIDIKKTTTTTNVTLEELQNIPSARDPWVVMQTVPSIVVDRVNVGGSESGQQSSFNAKGASGAQNTWNLDGIPITDLAATGSTPTYYDFDQFAEMNFTTGGADAQNGTAGVGINFVLKQGANTPHGSSRYFYEREGLQGNNMPSALAQALATSQTPSAGCASSNFTKRCGNRTDKYDDYGFELGGPILKDRLWAWGSAGKTDVRILTFAGSPDQTILKDYALKLNGQANNAVRGGYTFWYGDKNKFGRGASATRPPETTTNQKGPTKMNKGEASFTLGNNVFLVGRYAHINGTFALSPQGGLDKSVYVDDGGVFHNSYYNYSSTRPQKVASADGSYFRGAHEVKFGYSWKKFGVQSTTSWPGTRTITRWVGYPNMTVQAIRDNIANTEGRYNSAYVGDTISWNRATINLGVRWDRSASSALPASVPAVPGFESAGLVALSVPGVPNAIKFNTVTPRLGINYSLGEAKKTQVRASYAMFAAQLGAVDASVVSPAQYSYIYYNAVDRNGNGAAELNEILFNQGNQGYSGFDPKNPTRVDKSVNVIGSDLKSPKTHELLFGIDREVMPQFSVSASFTYRRFVDLRWSPRIGVRQAQYQQTGTFTGTFPEAGSVSVPFYAINASAIPPGGGRESINRDGYYQRYMGIELSATKRMANRWQMRLGFSTNDHDEFFANPATSIEDPTPVCSFGAAGTTYGTSCQPLVNGGEVLRPAGGSDKSQIFVALPKYQFIANGMYQGPWGINLGANLVTRQGYSQPFYRSQVATTDALNNRKTVLLITDVSANRLPAVTSLDGRVEKAFKFGRTNLAVDFDVFNLFNNATVLGRTYDARLTGALGFLQTREILQPRIARLGLRFNF